MTDRALFGAIEPPRLHVMSYNIRRRMPHLNPRHPDRWYLRKRLLKRLLATEQPALLGVQEALFDQAEFVQAALGADYAEIGYGRDRDRGGERCPLFWDTTRLRLDTWDQHALSDTPELSGSTSWGNRDPRLYVTAQFTDLATGARFLAVNTHFDHRSPKARLRSAAVLARVAKESTLPVIVTGDFNSDAGSVAHRALLADGVLCDSWLVAAERRSEPWGTFPNYRRPVLRRKRIDWILASPTITVLAAAINVRRFARRWPSDHAPVQAILRLPG